MKPIMATSSGSYDEPTTNQRIASAFRSHFKMLVEVLDPEEAALALYEKKLISKTTLAEATSSNVIRFRRSLRVVEAVETILDVCNSSSDSLRILSILEKYSTPTSDGGVIARIRRDSMSSLGGEWSRSAAVISLLYIVITSN